MCIDMQVAGLKHFDDMQQRISRAEVELVHGIVCKAVSQLLQVQGQPDADRLHCRVTGSYIRGKPMTGADHLPPVVAYHAVTPESCWYICSDN